MLLLSRVAEAMYWLGRHVERAENTARLLDVTYHGRLEPSISEVAGATNTWPALIATLGLEERYKTLYGDYDEISVIEFLTPIPPGLDRSRFLDVVQDRIETTSNALLAAGRAELAAHGHAPSEPTSKAERDASRVV